MVGVADASLEIKPMSSLETDKQFIKMQSKILKFCRDTKNGTSVIVQSSVCRYYFKACKTKANLIFLYSFLFVIVTRSAVAFVFFISFVFFVTFVLSFNIIITFGNFFLFGCLLIRIFNLLSSLFTNFTFTFILASKFPTMM